MFNVFKFFALLPFLASAAHSESVEYLDYEGACLLKSEVAPDSRGFDSRDALSDYDEIARLEEPLKLKEFVICKNRDSELLNLQTRTQAMSSGEVYELRQFGVSSARMGADASCEVVDVERYAEAIKRVTIYHDD